MKSKIVSKNMFFPAIIGIILISLFSFNDAFAAQTINDRKDIRDDDAILDLDALDRFGYQIEPIEDLDGDGTNDLAVTKFTDDLPGEANVGSVLIMFMNSDGSVKSTNEILQDGTAGNIDSSCMASDTTNRETTTLEQLAYLGDLDGDGDPTLAVGAADNDYGVSGSGAIYNLELNEDGTVDNCFLIIPNNATYTSGFAPPNGVYQEGADGAFLGWPLIATDLNNDGRLELIAGASNEADTSTNLWPLFLNSTGGVDSHPDTPIFATSDLNLNQYIDDGATVDGKGKIVLGIQSGSGGGGNVIIADLDNTGGFSSFANVTSSFDEKDALGSGVTPLGDLDGDGVIDILVGNELGDDLTGAVNENSGEVSILFMNADNTVKETQLITNSTEATRTGTTGPLKMTDLFGHGMGVWQTVGNSIVVAISSHQSDTGGSNTGAIHLFYIEKISTSIEEKGGGGCDDCTPPTLGINSHGERMVDGGFSYNGNTVDAAYFHTEFPLINATIGEINIVKIKIYENQGVQNIQNIQFGLGVKEVGTPLSESEVIILIELLHQNGTTPKIPVITDKDRLIDHNSVNATVNTIKCKTESYNEDCLLVNLQYSYREAPKYNVMLVTPMDEKRNAWNFYFNDGIRVLGESLNPAPTQKIFVKKTNQALDNWLTVVRTDKNKELWTDDDGIEYQFNNNNFDRITPYESWTCKDKPLDQIKVPTRNNCNFRELTSIWSG